MPPGAASRSRKVWLQLRVQISARLTALVAAASIMLLLLGCGGSNGADPTTVVPTNTPQATPPPTSTATVTPATPTTIVVATVPATLPASTPASGEVDGQMIALGKQVFDETAGGIGCAYCHHADATGDLTIGSPNIRGVTEGQIIDALATRAQMSFITLSDEELKAVAAYLKTLAP